VCTAPHTRTKGERNTIPELGVGSIVPFNAQQAYRYYGGGDDEDGLRAIVVMMIVSLLLLGSWAEGCLVWVC